MQKGSINVQSENIFPIIKKFLYSDTEIFLRELVSNAVDASQKLMTLSNAGEYKKEVKDLKVEVILDSKKKTLTIRDHGIGMTQDEVNKYINEVAFFWGRRIFRKIQRQRPKIYNWSFWSWFLFIFYGFQQGSNSNTFT